MKTSRIIFGLITAVAVHAAPPQAVPGEYVVRLREGVSEAELAHRLAKSGLRLKETLNVEQGLYLAVEKKGMLQTQALSTLESSPEVELAEPNYIYRVIESPVEVSVQDAYFGQQWGLENKGQKIAGRKGKVGADISAVPAWQQAESRGGKQNVVVAVVDSGIDYNHPDLQPNIWSDGKSHGINAVSDIEDPMDTSEGGHGTHCAGVIGAAGNGIGVRGVASNVRLMGAKFIEEDAGDLADAIKAIDYAVAHGARVISASWGGPGTSRALEDSIRRAGEKGVVFVAAAGNGGWDHKGDDNDAVPMYPAGYKLPNVIAVAASDNRDELAPFSNFGRQSVLLMAPGVNILSTLPHGRYGYMSGTSMATPHVSGAVALLLSLEPQLSIDQIKDRLAASVDKIKGVKDKLISGGRLNLRRLIGAL